MQRLTLSLLPLLLLCFVSCKKCYHCKLECQTCALEGGQFGDELEVCKGDFSTGETYFTAIANYEFHGYTCKNETPTENECVNEKDYDSEVEKWEGQGYECMEDET